MKKRLTIVLAVLMITAIGCQKKEEPTKAALPEPAAQAVAPQTAPQTANAQKTAASPAVANPHASFQGREFAPGTGHKGKVLQVMNAGGYVYLEVEEKGQKLWVAGLKAAITKGDTVEFPDSTPMENFQSKTLKKTFAKIYFADVLRVVK